MGYPLSEKEYELEKINTVFDTSEHRWFRAEWKGHPGEDTWESERSLTKKGCEQSIATIQHFWENNKICSSTVFVADPDGGGKHTVEWWSESRTGQCMKSEEAVVQYVLCGGFTRAEYNASSTSRECE